MFERLVKARADVERNVRKLQEAQKKYDASVERLKEVEKTEILDLVNSQKMTPDELAEFLGMGGEKVPTVADCATTVPKWESKSTNAVSTYPADDEDTEMEDTIDEDF